MNATATTTATTTTTTTTTPKKRRLLQIIDLTEDISSTPLTKKRKILDSIDLTQYISSSSPTSSSSSLSSSSSSPTSSSPTLCKVYICWCIKGCIKCNNQLREIKIKRKKCVFCEEEYSDCVGLYVCKCLKKYPLCFNCLDNYKNHKDLSKFFGFTKLDWHEKHHKGSYIETDLDVLYWDTMQESLLDVNHYKLIKKHLIFKNDHEKWKTAIDNRKYLIFSKANVRKYGKRFYGTLVLEYGSELHIVVIKFDLRKIHNIGMLIDGNNKYSKKNTILSDKVNKETANIYGDNVLKMKYVNLGWNRKTYFDEDKNKLMGGVCFPSVMIILNKFIEQKENKYILQSNDEYKMKKICDEWGKDILKLLKIKGIKWNMKNDYFYGSNPSLIISDIKKEY